MRCKYPNEEKKFFDIYRFWTGPWQCDGFILFAGTSAFPAGHRSAKSTLEAFFDVSQHTYSFGHSVQFYRSRLLCLFIEGTKAEPRCLGETVAFIVGSSTFRSPYTSKNIKF